MYATIDVNLVVPAIILLCVSLVILVSIMHLRAVDAAWSYVLFNTFYSGNIPNHVLPMLGKPTSLYMLYWFEEAYSMYLHAVHPDVIALKPRMPRFPYEGDYR